MTISSLSELIKMPQKLCPALRIICLRSQPNAKLEYTLAKAGAFFCKNDPPDALLALLQWTLAGERKKNTFQTGLRNANPADQVDEL